MQQTISSASFEKILSRQTYVAKAARVNSLKNLSVGAINRKRTVALAWAMELWAI
jgi:hypothetical protein